jgi:hypothetical protein
MQAPHLHWLGAVLTVALGLLGLLLPARAAAFVGVVPSGRRGRSEVRATYGGFFLALGLGALWGPGHVACTLLGVGWVGAAAGRLLSIAVDRASERLNWGGVALELGLGLLLLVPG